MLFLAGGELLFHNTYMIHGFEFFSPLYIPTSLWKTRYAVGSGCLHRSLTILMASQQPKSQTTVLPSGVVLPSYYVSCGRLEILI